MGVIKFSGKMGPNSLKAKPRYVSGEIKNPAGGPPIHVTTNPATNLTSDSATLNGTVNPNYFTTNIFFNWGTTIAYGNTTPIRNIGNGHADLAVFAILNMLLMPNTTYHFQIVAINIHGTTTGADLTFTTPLSLVRLGSLATGNPLIGAAMIGTRIYSGIVNSNPSQMLEVDTSTFAAFTLSGLSTKTRFPNALIHGKIGGVDYVALIGTDSSLPVNLICIDFWDHTTLAYLGFWGGFGGVGSPAAVVSFEYDPVGDFFYIGNTADVCTQIQGNAIIASLTGGGAQVIDNVNNHMFNAPWALVVASEYTANGGAFIGNVNGFGPTNSFAQDANYAYFGATATKIIRRINLTTLVVDGLVTSFIPVCMAIDPIRGYLYYGDNSNPVNLVAVNTLTFTESQILPLNAGENGLNGYQSLVVDPTGHLLYAMTNAGIIVKIQLN